MKRTTGIIGAIGLVALLSAPAWAEAKKTYFTATAGLMTQVDPGTAYTDLQKLYIRDAVSTYVVVASDPRIAGPVEVHLSAVFDLEPTTGQLLGGRFWGWDIWNRGDGAWHTWAVGTRTLFTDEQGNTYARTTIVETGVGSGSLAGLVFRLTFAAVDAEQGGSFEGEGYIIEAKGGPSDRPVQSRSEGVESVEMVFFPFPEPTPLPVVKWQILDEVAQVSHLGCSSNEGLGMLDLLTGAVTGSGTLTSANGDQLYWVATGTSLGPAGPVDLTLHWAGGTGLFDAAVGAINGPLELEPTGDPSLMEFRLKAKGNIRY